MPTVLYPASLPCPQSAPLQRAERRGLSSLAGPRQSRVEWTDRLSAQTLNFIFGGEQLQTWLDWYHGELADGASWFSASWPQPEGGVGVRRFVGAPSYPEFLSEKVGWRVQAQCQIRGRGELPQAFLSLGWDPADKSPLTVLSNGDLDASVVDNDFKGKWALCTLALGAGKWFFEVEITGATGGSVGEPRPGIALGQKGYNWGNGDPDSGNTFPDDGSSAWSQSATANATQIIGGAPAFEFGDRLSFAADLDARKMWLYKNGVIVQGDPVAGTSHSILLPTALLVPLLAPLYWNHLAGAAVRLVTSPHNFVADMPSGYTAWGN